MDSNRFIVISGGGTGMGKAMARRFASDGDRVLILGRREEVLARTADEINRQERTERVVYESADLADPAQVRAVVEGIDQTIDVVVNNAGGVNRDLPEATIEDVAARWEADFQSNVLTAVLLTTALLPRLRRPGGRIITISSIAALRAGGDSYGAAKGALIPWTYSQAAEVGPDGITVNVIAPGYVEDTEFFGETMNRARRETLIAQTLVGRPGRPEDVAETVHFLASKEAALITGQIIQVNGGALFGG